MVKILKTKKLNKNIKIARSKIDGNKQYNIDEAISTIKSLSYVKFDSTLEIAVRTNLDPRHSDQNLRVVTSLPAGTGKNITVGVFCKEEKINDAIAAGAEEAGPFSLIEDIKAGKIKYDVYIASPDMMGLVGQVARILGPKGKMPNPKIGTVAQDIVTAIKNAKGGQVELRVEKNGIIHTGAGKLSFDNDGLNKNVNTILSTINNSKPSGAKGTFIKSVYLTSTMGPSIKIASVDLKVI